MGGRSGLQLPEPELRASLTILRWNVQSFQTTNITQNINSIRKKGFSLCGCCQKKTPNTKKKHKNTRTQKHKKTHTHTHTYTHRDTHTQTQTSMSGFLRPQLARPRATPARAFLPTDLLRIYSIPNAISAPAQPISIIVLSFGGGLFGTLSNNGVLTQGDVQTYWTQLGISPLPEVRIQLLGGMQNAPVANDGATVENTIDVEMVGACCPNSVITLIIAPNTNDAFSQVLAAASALHGNVVSCSWGFPESAAPPAVLQQLDAQLQSFAAAGVNVCCASGDDLATDGTGTLTTDFPGSSPHVVCCGGTSLLSPTDAYTTSTQETVWNSNNGRGTGGGKSKVFAKPAYQANITLSATNRMVPDVGSVADPATGVIFLIGGTSMVIGGTSIAAPFYAGSLARMNVRTFVNPLLYQAPRSCFHDIISGNNGGYSATVGYDLASGLGSLNGAVFQSTMLQSLVPVTDAAIGLVLHVGQSVNLQASLAPVSATHHTVTWQSSNSAVVRLITASGSTPTATATATAVHTGVATIRATSSDGPSDALTITVA